MRFILRTLTPVGLTLLLVSIAAPQTATESNILSARKKGASDEQLIQLIRMSKRIDVDLSFENLPGLMDKGLSQKVIDALITRKEELGGNSNEIRRLSTAEPSPASRSVDGRVAEEKRNQGTCPTEQGVYYHSASDWVRLEPINPQPDIGKVRIMKVTSNWKFQGAEAPLKVQAPKAEFCLRNMDINLRNIALAVLKKSRNSREVEYSSIGNLGQGSARDPKKFRPVNASRVSEGLVIVTLDLEDGEYALDLIGMPQYDFSVRTK